MTIRGSKMEVELLKPKNHLPHQCQQTPILNTPLILPILSLSNLTTARIHDQDREAPLHAFPFLYDASTQVLRYKK